ncbi:MAG TPA: FHIPEP family type III secretion protein, partial [Kofleriaceae bacterium]|nr:FHIPEP family type III secretion protein [Kofleriaceae bacterium]
VVPGLPAAPFAVLAAIAIAAALLAARARPRPAATLDEPGADAVRGPRLQLALGDKLAPRASELHAALAELRAEVTRRAGVPIPPLAIARDAALGDTEAALAIDGTQVAWLALGNGDPIGALRDKLPGALALVVPDLLGIDRVAALVERAAARAPVVVREVVPRIVPLPVLAELLRELAREQVPLDDLPAILEALALAPTAAPLSARDLPAAIDHLRGQLRRQISARWAPRGQLAVYTVDAMIEDAVRGAIDRRDGGAVLALEPAIAQDIIAAVRGKLGRGPAVLLVSGDVRRHLRDLLEAELPDVAILAAHELSPGTAVTTAGRIEV